MSLREKLLALVAALSVAGNVTLLATGGDSSPEAIWPATSPLVPGCITLEIRPLGQTTCLEEEDPRSRLLLERGSVVLNGPLPAAVSIFDCPACANKLGIEFSDATGKRKSEPLTDSLLPMPGY
jgi:hypothetical protein